MNNHHNSKNKYAAKPANERSDEVLYIRIKHDEKTLFKQKAAAAGKSLSRWVVDSCLNNV